MRILIGLLLIILGFLLVWKSNKVVNFGGKSDWAEKNLGTSGGTNLMYKLIGILVIFFGLLVVTAQEQGFLEGTLGRLFLQGQ